MQDYIIGLGSNLGERLETLRSAARAIDGLAGCEVRARSPVYQSAPVGPPQPDYLNAALRLHCPLPPLGLLDALLGIERAHGRERRERWGPRTLDLDILYGPAPFEHPRLRVPHPELGARWFALLPLLDVAPELSRALAGAPGYLENPPSPIGDAL